MEFDTAPEGRTPVREQLEAVITSTLEQEFHAQALSLSCKQLDSELSRRLERLMAQLHVFKFEVEASRGGPRVAFEGSFRVLGVDQEGWIAFQTSSPEPERLRDSAIRHLRHLLADEALGRLIETSNAAQKKAIDRWLLTRIQEEFGLTVRVMDWLRSPLDQERHATKAWLELVDANLDGEQERIALNRETLTDTRKSAQLMLQEEAKGRLEQLADLQERLRRVRVAGGSPDEEKELSERIAQLKDEQKRALSELRDDSSSVILPRLESARGLLVAGGGKAVPTRRLSRPEPGPAGPAAETPDEP
jgi:hypothetical protein